MLCPRSGHSFDEIVELSQASKSSVSTNINLLLNNGSVEYFTKPGERKRYFRLSKNYLKIRMENYKHQLEEELKIGRASCRERVKKKDVDVSYTRENKKRGTRAI